MQYYIENKLQITQKMPLLWSFPQKKQKQKIKAMYHR